MNNIITAQILDDDRTIETVIGDTAPFYLKIATFFHSCLLAINEDDIYLILKSLNGDLIHKLHPGGWEIIKTEIEHNDIIISDDFKNIFSISNGTLYTLKHGQFIPMSEAYNKKNISYVYGNKNDLILLVDCNNKTDNRLFHYKNKNLIPLATHGELTEIFNSRLSRILFFSDKDRIVSNIFQLQGDTILLIQSPNMDNDFVLLNITKKRKILSGFSHIVYSGKINDKVLLIDADGSIVTVTSVGGKLAKSKSSFQITNEDRIRSITLDRNHHWTLHCEMGIYKSTNGKLITLLKRKSNSIYTPSTITI